MGTTGLRNAAVLTFFVSIGILLAGGYFARDKVPPIPNEVVSDGRTLTDGAATRCLELRTCF